MSQSPFPEPDYKLPDQHKPLLEDLSDPDIDDTVQCQSDDRNGTIVLLIEKPPEVQSPTASNTTREDGFLVARQNNNTENPDSTIPKSGYGFYKLVLNLFLRHSDELVQELEKSHETSGAHGYPAREQLSVFLLQFLQNERYNKHLLNRLNASPELRATCKVNEVPSETALSRAPR